MARTSVKRPPFLREGVAICPLQDGTEAICDAEHFDLVKLRTWTDAGVGYVVASFGHENVMLHRYLWELINGPIPEYMEIDHINCDKKDNRLANLRLATYSQNSRNYVRGGSSRYCGVSESPYYRRYGKGLRWKAHIKIGGKNISLGSYDNEEDAHAAYVSAAEDHSVAEYLPVLEGVG